jgi:hypothetical protein
MVDPFTDGQITHLLSLLGSGRKRPFAVEVLAGIQSSHTQLMVKRHPHADRDEVYVWMLDHLARVGKGWGIPKCSAVSSAVSWRLVLTAVIWNSGSALKAGMCASRAQPLRILAPMMPIRIFSVAMTIFPLCFQVDGDDAHKRERRKCCEDNNFQDRSSS